jgi:hypothetical protein
MSENAETAATSGARSLRRRGCRVTLPFMRRELTMAGHAMRSGRA